MAEHDESTPNPPHGSFGTFWNYITSLKPETLPPQLDRTMMRGKSGTDQAVINMGLKFFGFVDPDRNNEVLDSLKRFVGANGEGRKAILGDLVRTHYPQQMDVSARLGTEKLLHESFEAAFGLTGETRRKAATFFLHAAITAGIPVSPNFPKARAGQGRPASGAAKKATTRKRPAAVATTEVTNETGGDTYTINLESGGTVQLIVAADLMSLLRHDGDRTLVTELIEKMEGYEGDVAAYESDDNAEADEP